MPPPAQMGMPAEQPTWQKFLMGMAMGGTAGCTLGFIFGSFAIITRGAGPRGPWHTLAQYMMTSGGTFALFMSVGSVVRTEPLYLPPVADAERPSGAASAVRPRPTGAGFGSAAELWRMKARWAEAAASAAERERPERVR